MSCFSKWDRARKAVVLCVKYVRILRGRVNKSKDSPKTEVLVCDLVQARRLIVKAVQAKKFKEEIIGLNTHSKINSSSSIAKLDPYIDGGGVLRVGGRLRRAPELSEGVKFPAVLPKDSHVTTMIIRHFHEAVKHQGRGMTLSEVRANGYWIVGGTSAVGSIVSKCVTCRKLRAAVHEQKMADLPGDRLEPAPPFTTVLLITLAPGTLSKVEAW